MSVTHDQSLAILITAILVELDVVHYLVFDRCLQQLARSFLEQLFEKRLLFIFSSLIERDHFTLWHWRILSFWRPRVRPPGFFFVTERMRLFSAPHPQLSVITPESVFEAQRLESAEKRFVSACHLRCGLPLT